MTQKQLKEVNEKLDMILYRTAHLEAAMETNRHLLLMLLDHIGKKSEGERFIQEEAGLLVHKNIVDTKEALDYLLEGLMNEEEQ